MTGKKKNSAGPGLYRPLAYPGNYSAVKLRMALRVAWRKMREHAPEVPTEAHLEHPHPRPASRSVDSNHSAPGRPSDSSFPSDTASSL